MQYQKTTKDIKVLCNPVYIKEQSALDRSAYVFAYFITIVNCRGGAVQLISRTWNVENGDGHIITIEGDGVIGKQPIISPLEIYQYDSYTVIDTPIGNMVGAYMMKDIVSKKLFKIAIPPFPLIKPGELH